MELWTLSLIYFQGMYLGVRRPTSPPQGICLCAFPKGFGWTQVRNGLLVTFGLIQQNGS